MRGGLDHVGCGKTARCARVAKRLTALQTGLTLVVVMLELLVRSRTSRAPLAVAPYGKPSSHCGPLYKAEGEA